DMSDWNIRTTRTQPRLEVVQLELCRAQGTDEASDLGRVAGRFFAHRVVGAAFRAPVLSTSLRGGRTEDDDFDLVAGCIGVLGECRDRGEQQQAQYAELHPLIIVQRRMPVGFPPP